jgi:hypothetical protein
MFSKNLVQSNYKKKINWRKKKNLVKVSSLFKLAKLKYKSIFKNKFDICLKANNMFFTFALLKKNKIIQSGSSGLFKIKITKKKMKYIYKKLIDLFINKLKKKSKLYKKKKSKFFNIYNSLIVNITAKKRIHKRILKKLKKLSKRIVKKNSNHVVVLIRSKKCFNGCRVSKKRRKKRIKFRIFG